VSVIVILVAASDSEIDRLEAAPEGFSRFMLGGALVFANAAERALWFRDGIPPKSLEGARPPSKCDMDKAWAAIDFLLTKVDPADPLLRFIETGGTSLVAPKRKKQPCRDQLARMFRSDDVRRLANALRPITSEELAKHCRSDEMKNARLYPFGAEWSDSDLTYVLHWYGVMKAFIEETAERSYGVLVSVT
jgi:hypothetical protein